MEIVRINRIQVTNLFGRTNYDINLEDKDPIGILTAPNGAGKTTIMKLLDFLLNSAIQGHTGLGEIFTVPFDEFRCVLSDGKTILIHRLEAKGEIKENYAVRAAQSRCFISDLGDPSIDDENLKLREFLNVEKPDLEVSLLDENLKEIKRISCENLLEKILAPRVFPKDDKYIADIQEKLSDDLLEIHSLTYDISVDFIKSDRIESKDKGKRMFVHGYSGTSRFGGTSGFLELTGDPFVDACLYISAKMKEAHSLYSDQMIRVNGWMIERLVNDDWVESKPDIKEFRELLSTYNTNAETIRGMGLNMPSEDVLKELDLSKIYEDKGDFLWSYLVYSSNARKPFVEIYRELKLFKDIFDERNAVTRKRIEFSEEKGIAVYSGNKEIHLHQLSSGEKHDFIMWYRLIFDTKPGSLVLIDEPEISLHIDWQETFIDTLMEICEMNELQAIVATHSPSIVGSHYDLIVDKGETDA